MAREYGIKTSGGKKEIEEQIVVDVMSALGSSKPMVFAFTANKSSNKLTGNRDKDGSLLTEGKPMDFSGTSVEKKVKEIAKAVSAQFPAGQDPMNFAKAATQSIVQDLEEVVANPNPDETAEDIMADKEVTTIIQSNAMKFSESSVEEQIEAGIPVNEPQVMVDDEVEGKGKPMNLSGVVIPEEEEVVRAEGVGDAMNFAKAADAKKDKDELVTEKQIAEPEEWNDELVTEKQIAKPEKKKETPKSEKPGWVMAEGSNFWSIDTKDPHWSTEEGYQEAIDLYGKKPSWAHKPEEEDEEDFVDLSIPDDIKKLFG